MGILCTPGGQGALALPVRYHSRGVEVDCLVPLWTDVAYHLEQDPRVLLIVQTCYARGLCWLQLQGTARPVVAPGWADLLPGQFDEGWGWGVRETLDM